MTIPKFLDKILLKVGNAKQFVPYPVVSANGNVRITEDRDSGNGIEPNIEMSTFSDESVYSLINMYDVLCSKYGPDKAQELVEAQFKRNNNLIKGQNTSLLGIISKKANVVNNHEILAYLNAETTDYVKSKQIMSFEQKHYRGKKLCYIPVLNEGKLVSSTKKYFDVKLKPATLEELADFVDNMYDRVAAAYADNEYQTAIKQSQIAYLFIQLLDYKAQPIDIHDAERELAIYKILTTIIESDCVPAASSFKPLKPDHPIEIPDKGEKEKIEEAKELAYKFIEITLNATNSMSIDPISGKYRINNVLPSQINYGPQEDEK